MARDLADIVARNIRLERSSRHWRREHLAELLGWDISVLSGLESGTRRVHLDDLPILCRVFGVPLSRLIDGADSEDLAVLGLIPTVSENA